MADNIYWHEPLMRLDGAVPSILAIGDSWFWYPLPGGSLASSLAKLVAPHQHTMLVFGNNGAEAFDYVDGVYAALIDRRARPLRHRMLGGLRLRRRQRLRGLQRSAAAAPRRLQRLHDRGSLLQSRPGARHGRVPVRPRAAVVHRAHRPHRRAGAGGRAHLRPQLRLRLAEREGRDRPESVAQARAAGGQGAGSAARRVACAT